jgi:hypothetical protein
MNHPDDPGCRSNGYYDGDAAAEWAVNNYELSQDELSCTPGEGNTRCTCFAASAINIGFGEEVIIPDPYSIQYIRSFELLDLLINDLHYSYYEISGLEEGLLGENQEWEGFLNELLEMDIVQPGDLVFYDNESILAGTYNHVAIIIGYENREGVGLWPIVVDMDGHPDIPQVHFIDGSPSTDILSILIVTINR